MNDGVGFGSFRVENVGVLWRKSLLSRRRTLDILLEGISVASWHNYRRFPDWIVFVLSIC